MPPHLVMPGRNGDGIPGLAARPVVKQLACAGCGSTLFQNLQVCAVGEELFTGKRVAQIVDNLQVCLKCGQQLAVPGQPVPPQEKPNADAVNGGGVQGGGQAQGA